MLKNIILAAVALCVSYPIAAAEEVHLGVDSLLRCISRNNADVKSARSNYEAVKGGIDVAENARLPQITASLELSFIGDGTVLNRDFTNAMRDKLPHFGNSLSVNVYQPIYQGGAISSGIELSRLQADLAEIGIAQQLDAVSIQGVSAYFNLLKMYNLKKVYEENIAITRQLIEQMTEHYKSGTALRNDITRYELRLSSLQYDLNTVNNSISVFNNDLVSLLCFPQDCLIIPSGVETSQEPDLLSEDFWAETTVSRSTDLLAVDKTEAITNTLIKIDKAEMLPSVGIVLGDKLSGPVTFEIPALNKNYNFWFAGVNVGYNFSSLFTTKKKIAQKELQLLHISDQRNALEISLRRKVHEIYVAAVQAQQMLDTETVNVRLANENYDIVSTRFHNDMALLTDMLDASTAKLDAETRLVNAHINLLLGYYQLKYISNTLTL